VAVLVAIIVYSMPVGQAGDSAFEGAVFGFWPIMWIVINALWIFNMTEATGQFEVLKRAFATISDDLRVQVVVIAFCFGALLEALAGFGTPVAICGIMSDTSTNSLFGALQVAAAHKSGLSPTLLAGANSSGGRPGEDDLAPEPRDRRGRGRPRRAGGRHLQTSRRLERRARAADGRARSAPVRPVVVDAAVSVLGSTCG
jgi:hypothetical protein